MSSFCISYFEKHGDRLRIPTCCRASGCLSPKDRNEQTKLAGLPTSMKKTRVPRAGVLYFPLYNEKAKEECQWGSEKGY
eukprot:1152079-Pelagomonas_calceolata.AAC.6